MKKKHTRAIIISVLALALVVTAILRMDIKPAAQTVSDLALSSAQQETPSVPEAAEKDPSEQTPVLEQTIPTMQVPEGEFPSADQPVEQPDAKKPPETAQPAPDAPPADEVAPPEVTQPAETPDVSKPESSPVVIPSEPERHVCTIEIRCDTVADTSVLENQAVAPFVPANGVILETTEVEYTPGESVFDILLRATMERNIHLEFRDDNLYSGKYIEGINYLYDMDGGPLSGWMYKVNGQFPNYGCAAYKVKDGDAIVWMYTCDLGLDVGDNSTW